MRLVFSRTAMTGMPCSSAASVNSPMQPGVSPGTTRRQRKHGRAEAVAYLGISPSTFDTYIEVSSMAFGRQLWDRHAIDRWVDGMKTAPQGPRTGSTNAGSQHMCSRWRAYCSVGASPGSGWRAIQRPGYSGSSEQGRGGTAPGSSRRFGSRSMRHRRDCWCRSLLKPLPGCVRVTLSGYLGRHMTEPVSL